MSDLNNPVGVFDAGIGSLAVVNTIHSHYPNQDIIWLADRASFPLGQKTSDELFEVGKNGIDFLLSQGAKAVVVAANVLSIVVLERLEKAFPNIQLFGVMPPVQRASEYGDFCVLGVKSMVEDRNFHDYIEKNKSKGVKAFYANASPLIDELVETGLFVSDPRATLSRVEQYIAALPMEKRSVSAFTLSSTHLPWLKNAFEAVCSSSFFIDPAEELVLAMNFSNDGRGRLLAFTTENQSLLMTKDSLLSTLALLGINDVNPILVPEIG